MLPGPVMLSPFRLGLALAALAVGVLFAPSAGQAQRRARLDAQVGVEVSRDDAGEAQVRPATRLQLAVEAAGPLEVGVYFQSVARALPLRSPVFGGGLAFALRPTIESLRLRPLLQASAGYAALPDEQQSYGALDLALTGGLAVDINPVFAIEVRGSHHWLLGIPRRRDAALPDP